MLVIAIIFLLIIETHKVSESFSSDYKLYFNDAIYSKLYFCAMRCKRVHPIAKIATGYFFVLDNYDLRTAIWGYYIVVTDLVWA